MIQAAWPKSIVTMQPCSGRQFVESGQKAIRTIEHLYQFCCPGRHCDNCSTQEGS
jgi:hypothetical protein